MQEPLFSIIIPTYNNSDVLPGAVTSIIDQEFQDWELIIVDDGSKDDTAEMLKQIFSDSRLKYYYQENKGVTTARNNGVKKANGEFIAFLDSDDKVEANWLKDFEKLIRGSEKVGYVSCGYLRNGHVKLPKFNKNFSPAKYSSLAGTFAIRRTIFLEIGGYDPELKQSENWEMTARALNYCDRNGFSVEHTNNINFTYDNYPTAAQTKLRDEYRGDATYYLYKKYRNGGILHYRRNYFLLSSAVNYTRAEKFNKSRNIFYKNLRKNPTFKNFVKVIIFEIAVLRRIKWMRKNKKDSDD